MLFLINYWGWKETVTLKDTLIGDWLNVPASEQASFTDWYVGNWLELALWNWKNGFPLILGVNNSGFLLNLLYETAPDILVEVSW